MPGERHHRGRRGPETGGFPGPNTTTASAFKRTMFRVFSPTLIGEFKGGYVKLDLASLRTQRDERERVFGLKNTNIDEFASGLGTVTINGYTPLGDSNAVRIIIHNRTQQYQRLGHQKQRGAHSIKLGGGVIVRRFGVIQSIDLQGTWTFDTTLTRSSANVGGNSAASFMLGYPTTAARIRTPFKPQMHTNEPSVFVQDDWRATSWLTVNLGVRYDVFTPFSEEANNMPNRPVWAGAVVLVAGENGVSRYAGIKTDYTDLAPRVGFAATLPHAIVLRGGYGLSFFPANTGASYYLKNPPVIDTYGPVTSAGTSGGVPTVFFDGLPPPATQRPSTDPAQLAGALRAVALDFKSTRMQQFNVQAEKELGANNVVTIGYVGSRGFAHHRSAERGARTPGPGLSSSAGHLQRLPNVISLTVGSSIYTNRYDALQGCSSAGFIRLTVYTIPVGARHA